MTQLTHWTIERRDNEIAVLSIDIKDKKQNVLSREVLLELQSAVDEIKSQTDLKGLIIASAKEKVFIAGADVSEFQTIENQQQAYELIHRAHEIFDQIEALPFPTIAMINGHCLGGGMELALACDYRISTDDSSARLGLPEVKLGIHPGFGGTVRMIETAGVSNAMNIMLAGRAVVPYVAKKMGMVDAIVPPRQLLRTADYYLAKGKRKDKSGLKKIKEQTLNSAPGRKLLAGYLEKQVAKKARKDHYPAPYALIDLWKEHGGNRRAMLDAEQQSVAELIVTEAAQNLVHVFFLQESLKKLGRQSKRKFKHVHVIGAGTMGGDIAAWSALRGLNVTLSDLDNKALAKATKRAHDLFKKKLKVPRLVELAMDRLQQDPNGNGVKNADIIIEAIVEKLEVKRDIFSQLEKSARADAILATNTSSIPLESICTHLEQPHRLVGVHFFNPVAKMQLVEIVKGELTDDQVADDAAAFASQISRMPIPVKSSPGFLVNRILMPYLLEAVTMYDEGIDAATIDKVACDFGMPMGPIELADVVGLDICKHVAENLLDAFGGELSPTLEKKIKAEHLGKKSGQGFYEWNNGKPVKDESSDNHDKQLIEDRLIFRYLNECFACLEENVVTSKEELDGAMIFGTGFAPFRGGPIHYIDTQEKSKLLSKLEQLNNKFGKRFKPNKLWQTEKTI